MTQESEELKRVITKRGLQMKWGFKTVQLNNLEYLLKQDVLVMKRDLDNEIQTLEAKINDYESGRRGACFTCEPVGELNKKLEDQLELVTKCYCAGDRLIGPTCNGCKNKKLLNKEGDRS